MTIQPNVEWQSGPSGTYRYYTKPIRKSPQDDREYRLIRLENGLEAMLVHDAKADKAGCISSSSEAGYGSAEHSSVVFVKESEVIRGRAKQMLRISHGIEPP